MELRREMRKITFKSLSYSDHLLVILSKFSILALNPKATT
jgi:hypothetical protein